MFSLLDVRLCRPVASSYVYCFSLRLYHFPFDVFYEWVWFTKGKFLSRPSWESVGKPSICIVYCSRIVSALSVDTVTRCWQSPLACSTQDAFFFFYVIVYLFLFHSLLLWLLFWRLTEHRNSINWNKLQQVHLWSLRSLLKQI